MEEIWKPVNEDGFEGVYEVSNLGRVRSLDHKTKRGMVKGKYLKPGVDWQGYHHVVLYNNGVRKVRYIHRLVAIAFIENVYNHPQVNHKDENKANNQVSNLEWCSDSYNLSYGMRGLGKSRPIEDKREITDREKFKIYRMKLRKLRKNSNKNVDGGESLW